MEKERIIAAGENALALAQDLVAILLQSNVPPAHWDEVLSRLRQLLAEHVPDFPGDDFADTE